MLISRLKKYSITMLVLILLFSMTIPRKGIAMENSLDNSTLYNEIIIQEAEWIKNLQFDSGAIPTYSDPLSNYGGKYKVIPYFTNIGLLGLLESQDSYETVRRYMDWYFNHLNREGTSSVPVGSVYDYFIETDKQTEAATNDFDSTDSYAATFINVLRKYAEVTGDYQYLVEHKEDIQLVANAMLSTQQADGLTWAKPSYKVKYLMDNSEVYKGLGDMVWISSEIFHDQTYADTLRQHKDEVYTGIQNELWLENKQVYSHAKMDDGTLLNPDWNTFYADSTAQLFPIWTGVLDPKSDRAIDLYNTFNEYHPGWPELQKDDAFPWALIAYTASIMGDKVRVDRFLESVKETYVDQDHPWPWYVMESGLTMLTASNMIKLLEKTRIWTMDNLQDSSIISEVPFAVNGTAQGINEVTFKMTNELTQETKTFSSDILNDGSWSVLLEGLINGQYQADIYAKDQFNNILFEEHPAVEVKIGGEGEVIETAELLSDRSSLHREESTELKMEAYYEDGTPVDLEDAKIAYTTNQPDLVEISENRILTLKGLPQNQDEIKVWAFVEKGYNAVKTNTLTIRVSREALTLYDDVLDRLSGWLTDQQLENGAITFNAEENEIKPMASNIGVLGYLLREETLPNAKKYVNWYLTNWNWGDHLGVYGTQYDYQKDVISGEWVKTRNYDSSSANIASFISFLRAYYEKNMYFEPSQYHLDIITGGLGIMKSQDSDGLMWRYPQGNVKIFSDNAITNKGMKDSVWLFENHFESSGPAGYFNSFATQLYNGIENQLWDEQKGYYLVSIQDQQKNAPDLSYKEDASDQLLAISTGLVTPDSEKAKRIYDHFNHNFPKWFNEGELSGSDASILYTAALMGDKSKVDEYLVRLITAIKQGNLPEDLNVEQAGYLMLAANHTKQLSTDISVDITNLEQSSVVSRVSVTVKGEAKGAKMVRISWRERYGTEKGVIETKVLPNGKWIDSIKKLESGSEYEITVSAIDQLGYNIPNTKQSVRVKIKR
jgi:hypothetical protein